MLNFECFGVLRCDGGICSEARPAPVEQRATNASPHKCPDIHPNDPRLLLADCVEIVRLPRSSRFTANRRRRNSTAAGLGLALSGESGTIIEEASRIAPLVTPESSRSDFFNTIGAKQAFLCEARAQLILISNSRRSLRSGSRWELAEVLGGAARWNSSPAPFGPLNPSRSCRRIPLEVSEEHHDLASLATRCEPFSSDQRGKAGSSKGIGDERTFGCR